MTPGLCFDLRLSTQPESTGARSRYAINLGHQPEGIGPLLAAGVRQQPAAIVSTLAPPMSYWHGAFRAVFPGTKLVKGRAPAGLCRTTKTFSGSGGQGKNFGIARRRRIGDARCLPPPRVSPPAVSPHTVTIDPT